MINRMLVFATVVLLAGLPLAAQQEPMMSVEPNPAIIDDPLLVTVDSDGFFCRLMDPVFLDGRVIVINATTFCDDPPPDARPPRLFDLLLPLDAGIWEVQLNFADLPVNYPLAVIETLEVRVTSPHFDLELDPPVATEDDEVVASVTLQGICPELEVAEINEGLIRIQGQEAEICVPNDPSSMLEIEVPLGRLPAGEYLVELVYDDSRVAERELSVLPAGACVADQLTLCLDDGRFRVITNWTGPQGVSGSGQAVKETDDSGLFWFFTPGNIELVVKVLDACATPSESFWVFAAGLTDVGVELRVEDTVSGEVITYQNPLGTRFETIADTAAFDTCP